MTDCSFLDLFAGSGNIGIEALSRGAANAVFVENNKKNLMVIKENLHLTGLADKARLIHGEVKAVLPKLGSENQVFDIIFLDPPYLKDHQTETLAAIARHGLLKPDGILILEHSKRNKFNEHPHFDEHRNYGQVNFSFFK